MAISESSGNNSISLLFVAWTKVSRRSEQLSRQLGADYYRLDRREGPALLTVFKLGVNFIKTLVKLFSAKPDVVFTFQAHPFVTTAALFYKFFSECKVVPDLHTAAYTDYDFFFARGLSLFLWQRSDLILVHNQESSEYLKAKFPVVKDKLFVLEDPLPEFGLESMEEKKPQPGAKQAVFINRFASDEPVEEFLEAAVLHSEVMFSITGDTKLADFPINRYERRNIIFTGFISDESYVKLLSSADFIIALTKREMTLLSSGYEALSLAKPVIVSNTSTLRNYFGDAALYAGNGTAEIDVALSTIGEELENYAGKIHQLKEVKLRQWGEKKSRLLKLISD
ncbi:MAG: glycosyltransferase [Candidatus Marinimicrobia bacterium]|nr:glycosyltransferase [Candidatus Neomarinimicrobiota bacterium]MDP6593850.1 glycosyltransferase [Candidatus Neomarinimicrobiota bacterium]MDP6836868.1 glycosyltransferase [Candidatus Neomarinimicrobiota bacterium]MDP6967317.1 glycosyltransferase [Candidatus Neomarinimicrobiota bacterium]